MFYNILDEKRIKILSFFKNFKEDFYLAGGTALALQLGHRDSIDFDFFSKKEFDTKELFQKIEKVFSGHKILKVQEERNTLSVLIDENIKVSFFFYSYGLLEDLIEEDNLKIASVMDIGCMKLSAVTGRASTKDYVDLFFILQELSIEKLLEQSLIKFKNIDKNLILKSIVYFEDIKDEPIIFKNNKDVSFEDVKKFLKERIKSVVYKI